uniref:Uncharacterized protein n=1 Tax=Setaria viridis TaxID=4556 RepID=A0A4V6D8G7_SETVI|nr:hypothetical protein SEVIR_4G205901v2 [Setaria viridis]
MPWKHSTRATQIRCKGRLHQTKPYPSALFPSSLPLSPQIHPHLVDYGDYGANPHPRPLRRPPPLPPRRRRPRHASPRPPPPPAMGHWLPH